MKGQLDSSWKPVDLDRSGHFHRLIVDDFVLPLQMKKPAPLSGEKRLLLAVFQDAVECFLEVPTVDGSSKKDRIKDARSWVMSDEDYQAGFSFVRCCAQLGLDAGCVRQALADKLRRGETQINKREGGYMVKKNIPLAEQAEFADA
jgi:hypothetical protein